MKQRLQAWGDAKVINIVGAFIFNENGEVLLLQRHTDDLGGGQWGTPGGRIEAGETTAQAMARELQEETGLTEVDLRELGAHHIRMPHGTVHMTSYHAVIPGDVTIVTDPDEHHDHRWFTLGSLLGDPAILYGAPSIMRDFGLLEFEGEDWTLVGGSSVELLS